MRHFKIVLFPVDDLLVGRIQGLTEGRGVNRAPVEVRGGYRLKLWQLHIVWWRRHWLRFQLCFQLVNTRWRIVRRQNTKRNTRWLRIEWNIQPWSYRGTNKATTTLTVGVSITFKDLWEWLTLIADRILPVLSGSLSCLILKFAWRQKKRSKLDAMTGARR